MICLVATNTEKMKKRGYRDGGHRMTAGLQFKGVVVSDEDKAIAKSVVEFEHNKSYKSPSKVVSA